MVGIWITGRLPASGVRGVSSVPSSCKRSRRHTGRTPDRKNYGELQNLVRMVLKKMRKDVSCEITAELFEEPVEKIRKIYEVAEKYAPEYDIESICRELAA